MKFTWQLRGPGRARSFRLQLKVPSVGGVSATSSVPGAVARAGIVRLAPGVRQAEVVADFVSCPAQLRSGRASWYPWLPK